MGSEVGQNCCLFGLAFEYDLLEVGDFCCIGWECDTTCHTVANMALSTFLSFVISLFLFCLCVLSILSKGLQHTLFCRHTKRQTGGEHGHQAGTHCAGKLHLHAAALHGVPRHGIAGVPSSLAASQAASKCIWNPTLPSDSSHRCLSVSHCAQSGPQKWATLHKLRYNSSQVESSNPRHAGFCAQCVHDCRGLCLQDALTSITPSHSYLHVQSFRT